MTDKQKQAICELRQRGLGHRKIAARLGISENTVKGHIRRNKLYPTLAVALGKPEGVCQQCGIDLADIKKSKNRKFCSDPCRRSWWKAHDVLLNRRAWYDCVCTGCGKAFKSYGKADRKYCGHPCYIRDRFEKELAVL